MTDPRTERVLARADELAALTENPPGLTRTYLTPMHRAANDKVAEWMRAAGLAVRIDSAGNVRGSRGADGHAALLIGSHLDSVPDAGKYDGVLGVLLGIEAAAALQGTDVPLEIIGFAEEEGVRFGTTLMTSRAVAGTWDTSWLAIEDANGTTLATAAREFGLDPDEMGATATDTPPSAYLEVHIEQGPVLESLHAPLGVVTAIAGARRRAITMTGAAAHAGTAPMHLRQDALVAAAEAVVAIEALAREHDIVATVGQLDNAPNGVNVVPAKVRFTIDARAASDEVRDGALLAIDARLRDIAARRRVQLDIEELHRASAVACDATLARLIGESIAAAGLPVHELPSGAGHDAMAIADLCPVAMLFVRCTGGVSHHPDEAVIADDVTVALDVLIDTIRRYHRA